MSIASQRAFILAFGASTLACGVLQWAGVTDDWNLWLSVAVFGVNWACWYLRFRREDAA